MQTLAELSFIEQLKDLLHVKGSLPGKKKKSSQFLFYSL